MQACRYAQHPMPNLRERKLNAISTLPGLMIVDDDPLLREGLAVAFGQDLNVFQAESRVAVIDLLRRLSAPPQPALVDLGLPPVPHRPDKGFHLTAELLAYSPNIRINDWNDEAEDRNHLIDNRRVGHLNLHDRMDAHAKPGT